MTKSSPAATGGCPSAWLIVTLFCALLAPAGIGQSVLRTSTGASDGDLFGRALAVGLYGSLDATPDLAAGVPGHDGGLGASQGRVEVLDGTSGATLFAQAGAAAGDQFGAAVALGGDIDGDTVGDLVVGAPAKDAGLGASQGQVRVFSGATGLLVFTLDGTAAGDGFGATVAILGDIDADGRAEFLVGAPGFDGTAGSDCGRVTIHSGATGLPLLSPEGTQGGEAFGSSLGSLPDINADGRPDFTVGAPLFDGVAGVDCGRGLILDGFTAATLQAVEGSQAGALLGSATSHAGDVNLDGVPDALMGAPSFDGTAGTDAGQVTVISGATGATLLTLDGIAPMGSFGAALAGGLDADRDGFADQVVGAPGFDGVAGTDTGRTALLSGRDGSELFAFEGTSTLDQEGQAVAAVGTPDETLRGVLASGAPGRDLSGSDRGEVTWSRLDVAADESVSIVALPPGTAPRKVVSCDADSDGDQDVVVLGASSIIILWNGDQVGSVATADLTATPATQVLLSGGANGVSLAAGQLDADAACEFIVGRSDGTVDVIDGTGTGASTGFALATNSPVLVDGSGTPGSISGVAIRGSGVLATAIAAGTGTFTSPGFIAQIVDPAGMAMVSTLISGGAFQGVVVGDIDGDTNLDVVATNNQTGSSGGVHVLDGAAALAPAAGSPFASAIPPQDLVLLDLDGDSVADDVAVSSIGFPSGGARVLVDYVGGLGFASTFDPGFAPAARSVAAGNFDRAGGDDLAVLNASEDLSILTDWNGLAFGSTSVSPLASGSDVHLAAVQLTAGSTPALCDTQEVVVVHLSSDLVSVWRRRFVPQMSFLSGTGCPPSNPTSLISLSAEPALGETSLLVDLLGASPLSLALLSVQVNEPAGSMPTIDATSGCGIALTSGPSVAYFTYTDGFGSAQVRGGIPDNPCLIGIEYLLQWGILDGGPYLGAFSVSDAILITVGER